MNICEACEQFKKRTKEWNYCNGAIDPLPYLDNLIKPHKHLVFEGRKADGAGTRVLVLHCLKCDQWWKLSAWPVSGSLEVLPYLPKDHSSHMKRFILAKKVFPIRERRRYERYIFPLHVRLESMTTSRKMILDLYTKDVSASGTFITTLTSFPEGTRFNLDFAIPRDIIEKLNGVRRLNGYTGSMVRSTSYGMAIHFDIECQIESLKVLIMH
ncbi:MAG TPA: PilZ domain-containing protein [Desulfobacterales bacterium]|nr:PilZ domain-containing protein [Desulfobacterales bacterium]